MNDLNRAVEIAEMAVEATPLDHPDSRHHMSVFPLCQARPIRRLLDVSVRGRFAFWPPHLCAPCKFSVHARYFCTVALFAPDLNGLTALPT